MIFLFRKRTDETVSHDINEIPEPSFSSTEDDKKTLPATSPITISPNLIHFPHLRFLDRIDMISLSADLPVIGGWEFNSDNVALWPRFKQIELVRTLGARKLCDPEESPICFYQQQCGLLRYERHCLGPTIDLCDFFHGKA